MSINDITGDALISRASSDAYRDNYDRIFGKKKLKSPSESETLRAEIERIQADAETFKYSNSRT